MLEVCDDRFLDLRQEIQPPSKVVSSKTHPKSPNARVTKSKSASFLELCPNLIQRDVAASGDLVVWSQADPAPVMQNRLRLRVKIADNEPRWLTPDSEFEYMPVTDGRYIAAARQSGGIIVYDRNANWRRIMLQSSGIPGDIDSGLIAAQGLSTKGGIGGGIWLLPIGSPEQKVLISPSGDSPRLVRGEILWKQGQDWLRASLKDHFDGDFNSRRYSEFWAWTEQGRDPRIWSEGLKSGEIRILAEYGALEPSVFGRKVAFLAREGTAFNLRVVDLRTGKLVMEVPAAGFPIGRSPLLSKSGVYWEQRMDRDRQTDGITNIKFCPI